MSSRPGRWIGSPAPTSTTWSVRLHAPATASRRRSSSRSTSVSLTPASWQGRCRSVGGLYLWPRCGRKVRIHLVFPRSLRERLKTVETDVAARICSPPSVYSGHPTNQGDRVMIRRVSLTLVVAATCVLGLAATADAASTSLALPQGPAFAILGHSCGGIQEKPYAIGWSAATGAPIGDVYLSTTCGGSGRGGGGGSTTYTAWVGVRWSFGGAVLADTKLLSTPKVNPALSVYDARGDQLYNQPVAGVVNGSQVSTQAYVVVLPPASPAGVTVTPSGGQFKVTWTNDPTAPVALISSSTVTATPLGSTAPVVTATANGN